jgi:hypothetical protein
MMVDKEEAAEEEEEAKEEPGYRIKNKNPTQTPHKDVGKNV